MKNNLRIITWNCRDGPFRKKRSFVEELKPDIIIIQEIPNPGKENDEHCIWIPSRLTDKKGVAVISTDSLSMNIDVPNPNLPEIFIPVRIQGKMNFNLLAVWTHKEMNYIESFEPILSTYRSFLLSAPSVIAGDFNSNAIWDRLYKKFNHSKLVNVAERDFGLVSAYHKFNKVKPGQEKEKTFYMYYHKEKPFHIDYCFVPKSWDITNVSCGLYDDWCNKEKASRYKRSDHCPLIVDLQIIDVD